MPYPCPPRAHAAGAPDQSPIVQKLPALLVVTDITIPLKNSDTAYAATIRKNSSATRDAPPTRAPSTRGWANNCPALSPLTLPPYTTCTSSQPACCSCVSINSCTCPAYSGEALRPLPIAQTGS